MDNSSEDQTSLQSSEKMEVLVAMYEQLDQNHHHHNKIIHRNYYLSVVFFGAILSAIISSKQSDIITAGIAIFGSFVMLLLGTWTYMYVKARRQIKERKYNIIREYRLYNEEFTTMDVVDEGFFFTHEETSDRSFVSRFSTWPLTVFQDLEHIKDKAEWGYFVVLAGVMLLFAILILI